MKTKTPKTPKTYYAVEPRVGHWAIIASGPDRESVAKRAHELFQMENGGLWEGRAMNLRYPTESQFSRYPGGKRVIEDWDQRQSRTDGMDPD